MRTLTMEQFFESKWSNFPLMSSMLDFNIFMFVYRATNHAKVSFKKSFDDGGFYGTGKKWTSRKKNYPHPILYETGDLKDLMSVSPVKKESNGRYKASIRTNETYGRRYGKKRAGYAAVHNDPTSGMTVNQYSSAPPVKRQFIGHNSKLYEEINRLYVPIILQNLM